MDWTEIWQKDVAGSLSLGPSTKSRQRLMVELLKRHGQPGQHLLDVGCGKGELLAQVARTGRFGSLTGADVSDVPLADARRNVPAAEFCVLDICAAALPRRFDIITCMMTLDLVPDERAAAHNLSLMLAPAGCLWVVVQHLKQYGSGLDDRYGVRRHDRNSLTALLSEAGLEPVQLFSWGFPLFSSYYRLLDAGAADAVSPARTRSAAFRAFSAGMVWLFQLDDLFTWTDRGRVLFGVFRKR
jgi:SAM-dependent methyltransferase